MQQIQDTDYSSQHVSRGPQLLCMKLSFSHLSYWTKMWHDMPNWTTLQPRCNARRQSAQSLITVIQCCLLFFMKLTFPVIWPTTIQITL